MQLFKCKMERSLVLLILIFAQVHLSRLEDPLITLPSGQIAGREDVTAEGRTYYAFEKVPYAAPPVGDLRFKPPQPVKNWDGVLNTTRLDVSCYQLSNMSPGLEQSEDCLFLNVFTPKIPSDQAEELLPVMFFIHDGGFVHGSAANRAPDLFINKDVILVVINYRLGVFGFISTQDDVIPGNNGLKDQLKALKWANQNIQLFGGDPERITIFGESAGAGSVAHLTLNQDATGLFQGAIMESGSFLCAGMFQRNSKQIAFGIGSIVDSTFETSENSEALLELLLSLSADDLNAAAMQYRTNIANPWDILLETGSIFAPVIEAKNPNAFLTKKMYGLLKAGSVLPVPVILGMNSEEKLKNAAGVDLTEMAAIMDENLDYLTPADMQIDDIQAKTEMGSKIRAIYTGGEPFGDHLGDLVRFSSDNFMTKSVGKHAELFSQYAPTYFYEFSYEGSITSGPRDGDGTTGVSHGEELPYIFCSGTSCNDPSIPEEDLLTRERLITLWTNFAKYKNPTPEPDQVLQNVTWVPVSTENGDFFYLNIGADLEVLNHPKGDAYLGWVGLYDSLGYDDFDTY